MFARVFWSGDPDDVAEIAAQADSELLQVVAPTRIGFSRAIAVARPEYIREQQRRHGGALLPAVTHDGIEDLFVKKASSVWYWQDGQWFRLTGAD